MCSAAEKRTIVSVTPEDLRTVHRSWSQLQPRANALLDDLTRRFEAAGPSAIVPARRARWLYAAVDELADLLAVPSRLADRARSIGATWPDPLTAPSFATEGRAWLAAADACLPSWSEDTADAWKQAWLLLSDVLAAEALSPFIEMPPNGTAP
jgi:hypothetical protein